MNTYNVTLEVGNAVMTNEVKADDWDMNSSGIVFYTEDEDGDRSDVAFYPLSRLIGIRLVPVTP